MLHVAFEDEVIIASEDNSSARFNDEEDFNFRE